jgi:glycosyltransferase involved in cell wall biosynthesis
VSTLNFGGAERAAVTLANELSRRFERVDLIAMDPSGPLRDLLAEEVHIVDLGTSQGRHTFLKLVSYLRREKPDIVMSLLTVPTILLGLTKVVLMKRSPYLVGSERSYYSDIYEREGRARVLYSLYYLAARIAYRLTDCNIALTTGIRDRMVSRNLVKRSKTVVLPNAIDLSKRVVLNRLKRSDGRSMNLLAIGRLNELKDYPTMIRAVKIVQENYDVHLDILGEGESRDLLSLLIHELGLEKQIFLHGNVLETQTWFEETDVFVLSSLAEGFPNVLLEALAHGVPIVSTDCPTGPRDIVNCQEFGELIPMRNPKALAEALIRVHENNYDQEVLRKRAEDFDVMEICLHYETLFRELLFGSNEPFDLLSF